MAKDKENNLLSKAMREKIRKEIDNLKVSDPEAASSQLFQQYAKSFQALDEKMDGYSTPDKDGKYPTVDEKGKEALLTAIRETAAAGEVFKTFLDEKKVSKDPNLPNLVTNLENMLSNDFDALSVYDPGKEQMTLQEIQQDAKTQVVDLRGVKLGKLGNAQSSRLPMTVVDASGRSRRGVFTKKTEAHMVKPFQEMIKSVKNDPRVPEEGKAQLDNMINAYRQNMPEDMIPKGKKREQLSDAFIVGTMFWELAVGNPDLKAQMKLGGVTDPMTQRLLYDGMNDMRKDVSVWINGNHLGLEEGARLDNRNSAVSSVANLLGKPDLVANSTSMKCIDEDGKEIEGTFMDFAEGADLLGKGNEKLFAQVSDDNPFDGKLYVQLADMQVLDYICGNVDRWGMNMTYKIDPKTGAINGVQGIDNDSSFGTNRPGLTGSSFRLQGANHLGIITDSMASTVSSLTPEMLKFSLRGHGLSNEEINAACKRLGDLKQAVKGAKEVSPNELSTQQGKLSIVKTAELEKASLGIVMMGLGNKRQTLFHDVRDRILDAKEAARERGYAFDPKSINATEAKKLTEVSTRDRMFSAGGIGASVGAMNRMVENEVTGFQVDKLTSNRWRSSNEFRDMVATVKESTQIAKDISAQIAEKQQGGLSRNDKSVAEQLETANAAMKRVDDASRNYLKRKMRQRGLDPENFEDSLEKLEAKAKNEYERKRIRYAIDVQKTVKEYRAINSEEKSKEREEVQQRLDIGKARREQSVEAPKSAEQEKEQEPQLGTQSIPAASSESPPRGGLSLFFTII